MPAAIAVPAIGSLIGGGLSLGGSALAAKGAQHGADEQAKVAQQALALQKLIYDKNMAMQQPYYNQGVQSLGALGQQAGAGTVVPLPGPAAMGGRSLGSMGFNPTTQHNAQMVQVASPDGEIRTVPRSVALQLVQHGATMGPFTPPPAPTQNPGGLTPDQKAGLQ